MMMMIIILIILVVVVVVVPYSCGGVGGVRVLQGTYRFICTSTTPDHIPFPFQLFIHKYVASQIRQF